MRPEASQKAALLSNIYALVTEFAYGETAPRGEAPPLNPDYKFLGSDLLQGSSERAPVRLNTALPVINRHVEDVRAPLEVFLTEAKEVHKDVVVIFDGLDRVLEPARFWSVVNQDLRLLRELEVSVIATAPLSVLFGAGVGQSISDHFDRVHHIPVIALEPANTALRTVLEKRRITVPMEPELADFVCTFSGGVLRDLISLARDAAEEAYVSDRDFISLGDIEKVAYQLGHAYLRGLSPEAIKALHQFGSSRSFDISQPANVELLLTRRVLEYSSSDFRVHPALRLVLPVLEPKRA